MNQLRPRVNSNERKSLLIPLLLGCQGRQQALLVSCTPPVLVAERWGKIWSFCVDVAVVSNVSDVSVVATVIALSPGEVRKAFTKCEMRTIEALLVSEASKQALMKVYLRREEIASGNRVYFPD